MLRPILIILLVFSYSISYADEVQLLAEIKAQARKQKPARRISIDFQDTMLKDVLRVFSRQSGINFICAEEVAQKEVTLYFENLPVKDAISSLFKACHLTCDPIEDTNIFKVK